MANFTSSSLGSFNTIFSRTTRWMADPLKTDDEDYKLEYTMHGVMGEDEFYEFENALIQANKSRKQRTALYKPLIIINELTKEYERLKKVHQANPIIIIPQFEIVKSAIKMEMGRLTTEADTIELLTSSFAFIRKAAVYYNEIVAEEARATQM